jgi:NADH-quinone oxidoreductase subunit M
LNSRFILNADGVSKLLILLTAISFPVIYIATSQHPIKNKNVFNSLMLFTQVGLIGVFLSGDALQFYFFWELALIPVYFLSSIWGGDRRVAVTFKFFIYTFVGSLLMLIGIILMYYRTADHSFLLNSFKQANITSTESLFIFFLFFIAFAIKMPIFPLHTWQPDAYEQAPTPVTMVLSAVMVKMGLYGVIKWLLPVFVLSSIKASAVIIDLSVIGILYASFIAIKQDDIKKLIAYSSIAHIGLMSAALFTGKSVGIQGAIIQLFSHGVNVLGLWIIANIVEVKTNTRKMSEMGGLAKAQPVLAIFLVVFAFANIALPLTNAFVGEFLMFNGLFQFNPWIAAAAGVSVILAAIYSLNMVQKVAYGEVSSAFQKMDKVEMGVYVALGTLLVFVFVFGVYPQPLFDMTKDTLQNLTK